MATTQYLLTPGWNLISSCLDLDNDSISSFLGPIKDHCISVWEYGSWKHYSPSGPPSLNTLDKIEHGKGYWINMKDTGTLPMIGKEITNKGIQLYGGWNMAGYNSLTSQSCDSSLSSISAYCICVWSYDNISKTWKCYFPGMPAVNTLTQFEPGKGYWINVSGDCLWDIGITNP